MISFVVIGISDNPHPFLSPEAIAAISGGRTFSGGKRHHEIVAPLLPPDAQWIDITVPLDRVFEQYKRPDLSDETLVVFASGDPLFYGFANTLRREFPEAAIRVFPSFNSLQLLAHRLVLPYHDLRMVSLTGRPWPAFDQALIERAPKIGILTDREHTPKAIARRMLDYGYAHYQMSIGEHLGNPSCERVTTCSLEEAAHTDFKQPNCLILTATEPLSARPFGLPDASFALLDGREKMITKLPVRLLTLQMLDLRPRHVLWDIGFCTGSVSIEARLQFPHLHVEAFEIREEGRQLMETNARRFGTPGIEAHIGDFCTTDCDALPAPDAVFIGGHGGQLMAIMEKIRRYLRPGGVVVMNAVTVTSGLHTPQSRPLFEEACRQLGFRLLQPLHIQTDHHNPIDILKCELPQ